MTPDCCTAIGNHASDSGVDQSTQVAAVRALNAHQDSHEARELQHASAAYRQWFPKSVWPATLSQLTA